MTLRTTIFVVVIGLAGELAGCLGGNGPVSASASGQTSCQQLKACTCDPKRNAPANCAATIDAMANQPGGQATCLASLQAACGDTPVAVDPTRVDVGGATGLPSPALTPACMALFSVCCPALTDATMKANCVAFSERATDTQCASEHTALPCP